MAATQSSRGAWSNCTQRKRQRIECLVPRKPGLGFQYSNPGHASSLQQFIARSCVRWRQWISSLETGLVTFLIAVIKYPDRCSSREEGLIPAHSWRRQSITATGHENRRGLKRLLIPLLSSAHREPRMDATVRFYFSINTAQDPSQGMVPPTVGKSSHLK